MFEEFTLAESSIHYVQFLDNSNKKHLKKQ